jgi:uncharacterized protein
MAEPQRARPKSHAGDPVFLGWVYVEELQLQRCNKCAKVYFPPRPFCPNCGHREVTVFNKASDKSNIGRAPRPIAP